MNTFKQEYNFTLKVKQVGNWIQDKEQPINLKEAAIFSFYHLHIQNKDRKLQASLSMLIILLCL